MAKNRRYRPVQLNAILFVAVALLALPDFLTGQFITLRIDVEPDVETQVVRELDFGSIPSGSGEVAVNPVDMATGIFAIRAIETQRLLISLRQPSYLRHESLEARIPLHLRLAYTDLGVDDPGQAMEINGDQDVVTIQPHSATASIWSAAHLYIYGTINVGNVPEGLYTADVILYVEYE